MSDSDEIKEKTRELFVLKNQLKSIGRDTKLLMTRVKELTGEIGKFMNTQDVDSVNVKGAGKVSQKVVEKKGPFNRNAVRAGLLVYFSGDETAVEGAMTAIEDGLPRQEVQQVSARAAVGT